MEEQEKEESYCIGRHVGEEGLWSLVGNQAGVEKLVIGRTDLNGNDQGTKNGTTK